MSEGYKLTELGDIPESWGVETLGKLFKLSSGDGLSRGASELGDYPVFGGNGISFYHSNYNFKERKIIIGRVGAYCGCVHRTPPKSWVTDNALILREKLQDFDDDFMYFLLNKLDLNAFANKNAQPVISGQRIYPIKIPLPPFPEQQKIASILSTVDEKIEIIDAQISQTQELKKGLMQQLLNKGIGHTKFKSSELGDIPESWEVVKLGDIGAFSRGKGISKSELSSHGIPCIRYGEIYTVHHFIIQKFYSFIDESVAENSFLIKEGDILFAGSGETAEDIGKAVAYIDDKRAYAGGDIIVLSPTKDDSTYLSYCLNADIIIEQRRKYAQGNSVVHIYSASLSKINIPVPPIEEQKRIASIFTTVDEKLRSFQSRKETYQQLKKGLMQQLLTGKIRVNTSQNEPALA